jgi:hypothetical protein
MSEARQYAVCVKNEGNEESLEVRKIYEVLSDPAAESRGFLRVIDEDEDYLYPASWFLRVQLPQEIETALAERCEAEQQTLHTTGHCPAR